MTKSSDLILYFTEQYMYFQITWSGHTVPGLTVCLQTYTFPITFDIYMCKVQCSSLVSIFLGSSTFGQQRWPLFDIYLMILLGAVCFKEHLIYLINLIISGLIEHKRWNLRKWELLLQYVNICYGPYWSCNHSHSLIHRS